MGRFAASTAAELPAVLHAELALLRAAPLDFVYRLSVHFGLDRTVVRDLIREAKPWPMLS